MDLNCHGSFRLLIKYNHEFTAYTIRPFSTPCPCCPSSSHLYQSHVSPFGLSPFMLWQLNCSFKYILNVLRVSVSTVPTGSALQIIITHWVKEVPSPISSNHRNGERFPRTYPTYTSITLYTFTWFPITLCSSKIKPAHTVLAHT